MKSIWGEEEVESDSFTGKMRTLAEAKSARLSEPPRSSRPPLDASPEERRLYSVFAFLRGKENYVKKAEFAADVLNGECGIKNELLAKLMMGPRQLKEILDDPRDVVPPLLELMESRDVGIRAKIAQALGERGDERALLRMYAGLAEEEYWARYEFSMALAKIARRITDAETVSEILGVMKDCAKRKDGVSIGLAILERHMGNIRMQENEKNGIPKALRKPPIIIEGAHGKRPDTTLKLFNRK